MPIRVGVGVRHKQQHDAMHPPYRLPTLLAVLDPVLPADVKRIIEHKFRRLEADVMLLQVDPILYLVLNELHRHSKNVTTV